MINLFILSFAILELIIDIIWSKKYYKLFEENKRLKKKLSDNVVNGTELELRKIRYLVKYYANRDKKGD